MRNMVTVRVCSGVSVLLLICLQDPGAYDSTPSSRLVYASMPFHSRMPALGHAAQQACEADSK
jgi:hypothetical protein